MTRTKGRTRRGGSAPAGDSFDGLARSQVRAAHVPASPPCAARRERPSVRSRTRTSRRPTAGAAARTSSDRRSSPDRTPRCRRRSLRAARRDRESRAASPPPTSPSAPRPRAASPARRARTCPGCAGSCRTTRGCVSPRALSGSTPPASVPNFIHGCARFSLTFSSLIRKYTVPMRWRSEISRSIAASSHGLFIIVAISPSRLPAYCLFSGFVKPRTSTFCGVASWQRFSHSVCGLSISALIFARVVGILQVLDELSVLRRPRRRARGQTGAAGDVRRTCSPGRRRPRARRVDLRDRERALGPVASCPPP